MSANLSIVVIEDETLAWEKLQRMIVRVAPGAKIEWIRTVAKARAYLQAGHTPDLIFSDIELLDGNAFAIYDHITPACPIIFCTAFDTFYVEAFKTNGIAYLLKPFNQADFDEAWHKFNLLFRQEASSAALLQQLTSYLHNQRGSFKEAFTVKSRDSNYLLRTADIAYFRAQGDFVLAIDQAGKKHALNYRLAQLAGMVDPNLFFQINRSEIVHFACIQGFETYIKNRVAIQLSAPSVTLFTSNSRTAGFREWLAGR